MICKSKKCTICVFSLLVLYVVQIAIAGTTGKIAGIVVSEETGEPIIGVNVIVEDIGLGAATNTEGQYTILNVPPGTYTVRFSCIGYADILEKEVLVRIDQTTRLDAKMKIELIRGEEVVVIAVRDLVKKDVSTSVTSITINEVEDLPVSSISEAVTLQAGVDDGFVIRGGEANEALFIMDGITLRDPRNNEPITNIALSTVSEISLEKGGFKAEYGQVRSGIINVITKEGNKSEYSGSMTIRYSPPTPKHFYVSPYDENSMWMKPFLDPEVCWEGTENGAWDKYDQRQYPVFDGWNKISNNLLTNSNTDDDLSPIAAQRVWMWEHRRRPKFDEPDYNIDAGFGGPVPFISKSLGNLRFFTSFRMEREMLLIPLSRDDYLSFNGTLKLTADIDKKTKLRFSGILGKEYDVAINSDDSQFYTPGIWGRAGTNIWIPTYYIRSPFMIAKLTDEQRPTRIFCPSWYSQAEPSYSSMAANLTHSISPTSFYETKIEYLSRSYLTGPIEERDTETLYEIVPGYSVDESPFGWSSEPTTGITGMFFGGHSSTARDSSSNSSLSIKFDYTNQISFKNQIKAGFDFSYYTLNFDFGYINKAFGSSEFVKDKENPRRFAAYIQDKYEADGFIVNLGLRLDYSDPNTKWVYREGKDIFDEEFFGPKYEEGKDYGAEKVKPDIALSPRLGVSHPITRNSKLYFNYGHFKQMPAYEQIFRIGRSTTGPLQHYGDPGLEQAATVSYELGYDHIILNNYLVSLSAFYNDITNQQALTTYQNISGSVVYSKANNDSYEDIRGLEITLRKSKGEWLRGFLTYTYQAKTYGQFGKPAVFENPTEQKRYNENTRNFYQNKPVPQPHGNANITFLSPSDFGPDIFGLKLFTNWSINLLGEWQAGQFITWNPNNLVDINNNVQVRDFFNADLKIRKIFPLRKVNITIFADILNLFNMKRLSGASFWDSNDYIYYMESLHLSKSNAYNNIVGNDRAGDYRKHGVEFQPIEIVGSLPTENISERAIYYNKTNETYNRFDSEMADWGKVPDSEMNKILEDKAYIDMPNQTSFNFLNPRGVFFGLTVSFKI